MLLAMTQVQPEAPAGAESAQGAELLAASPRRAQQLRPVQPQRDLLQLRQASGQYEYIQTVDTIKIFTQEGDPEDVRQQAAGRGLEAALVPEQPGVVLRQGDGGLAAGEAGQVRTHRYCYDV